MGNSVINRVFNDEVKDRVSSHIKWVNSHSASFLDKQLVPRLPVLKPKGSIVPFS